VSKCRAFVARLIVVSLACLVALVGVVDIAHAGSGLNTMVWGSAGYTVSSSSYKYSNMTGFVQALINSTGDTCTLTVDGIFGSVTTWDLATMENEILGYNNAGVMTPAIWNAFYYANPPGQTYDALIQGTFTDGYGTQYWEYYTGGGDTAKLGWNPIASQWLFSQYRSNPSSLVNATPSRTISAACD
jgi:hypothetical protein